MKKILILALAMIFCSYLSYSLPTVTIGTDEANTGEVVSVPVTMDDFNGADYAPNGITMFIQYDNTKLSTPAFTNINTTLFPGGITEVGNPGVMAYIWSSGSSAVNVPNGTVIFNLQFTYIGTTATNLTWNTTQCLFTNDNLDEIVVTYVNGGITPPQPQIEAPVLSYPTNGATGVATSPNLDWYAVAGATSYTLQVSTLSDFSSFVINQSGIIDTDFDLAGLSYLTPYYWRANATDGTATSVWSEVWNFTTMQEPQLEPTVTIGSVLANTGDVVVIPVTMDGFTGIDNAPNGITMFVQYDNTKLSNPLFTNINTALFPGGITETGNPGVMAYIWSSGSSAVNVPNGTVIFYLQFTYIGTTQTPVTWNTTQCLFTNDNLDEIVVTYINGTVTPNGPPPPVAPLLVSPLDEITGVSINPTLVWEASATATGYNINVSTDPTFATTIALQSTGTQIDVLGLNYETVYYWRVNATNESGTSDWSTVWMFTTMAEPQLEPTVTIGSIEADPGDIVVIPVTMDGFNGVDNAPNGVTMFIQYDNTVLSNPTFTNINTTLFPGGITEVGNPGVMAYIWSSGSSAVNVPNGTLIFNIQFTYIGSIEASPINWNVNQCLFTNDNLDEIVVNYINGAVIPLNPPEPPDPPVLFSPVDGSTMMPIIVDFNWFNSEGALNYYIEFSTNEDFTEPVWGDWTTENIYQQDFWYYGETYYWRVKAANGLFESAWSEVWDFTVAEFGVPVLVSPIDEAADVEINPTLDWDGVVGADGYNIEISDDPTFAITIALQTAETSIQVLGLNYLTPYYWRVNAYDEYQSSEWSTVWMFTTVNVPILPPVLVSPVDGAIDQDIDINLVWEAAANATTYNIEVSNDPTFATTIALQTDQTTIAVLGLNYETTYYWRVNGFNNNFTSEWSIVWDFTTGETPVPPVAPILVSPINGTLYMPVDIVTLDWNLSIGADYYNIEVADNADFTNADVYESSETALDIYNLDYLQTYYWRVNATNQNGTGDWSDVWDFTTAPFIPGTPELLTPPDGSIDMPLAVVFEWSIVEGADSYYIEFSHTEMFDGEVWGTLTTGTTHEQLFEDYSATYYWRVKAIADAVDGLWSDIWSLSTEAEFVPAPSLVAPLNGATGILITGTVIEWIIQDPAIESYYEVASDINFTNVLFSGWTDQLSATILPLDYSTEYFWKVKAKSALLNESEYSEVWSFITEDPIPPAPPILISPVDGTIDVPTQEIEFTWNPSEGAAEYFIEIGHDINFNEIHYSGWTEETEITLYDFEGLTTHYWRVKAASEFATGVWSEVWMFTTAQAPPFNWTSNTGNNATVIVPYIATPTINTVPLVDGDWVAAYSPLGFCVGAVEWTIQPPPQQANGITVWGDDDQTPFTDGMIVGQTIEYQLYKAETNTYYEVNSVTYSQGNGIYAVNGYYVISEMSYTDPSWIDPPVLVSPFDGEIDVPTTVDLLWQAATNATMYNVEVSDDPTFSYTIALQTAGTTIEIPGLLYNTTYYWRVNGFNNFFTSEWSEVWDFTTETEVPPCDPPTVQAKNLIFSNVTDASIKVRWTRGNGENVLVVAYPNGVDAIPEDGYLYLASPIYGDGAMLGTGYVVYAGAGDRVNVTGLTGGTGYTFKVYEYNYMECIAYNTDDANNNPRFKATLPAEPVIIPTTYKTDTGFEATWTFNGNVDWFEIYLFNSVGNLIDIYDVGEVNSMFIDELEPATMYFYEIVANYGGSYTFSNYETVITLDEEPVNGPINTVATLGVIDNTVNLSWEKPVDGLYSLVLAYTSDPTDLPVDASDYSYNTDYSLAPAIGVSRVVYNGLESDITITGLAPFEHYFFRVYSYNGEVSPMNTYPMNTENYNVTAYGATDIWNVVLPAPVLLTPDSKWEEGFSTYWTYAIAPDYFELMANDEVFDLPGDFRDFDVDGLLPNTIYDVKIRAIYSDIVSDWSNIEQIRTLALEPIGQPTNLVFTNITDVSATLTWTKGAGAENTIVLAHQLGLTGQPEDNFGYPAGNPAYGTGEMLGGAFIVYNGTGNSFELTNLVASGIYYFELFAYNGVGILGEDILNSFNYNVVDPLLGQVQTTVAAPTVPPTNVIFPAIGTTQMNVAWTPGNGTYSIVLAKNNNIPFTAPSNGVSYVADPAYGLGDVIGGAYVVYVGTDANVTVTGLAEGTEYYFAVYTFNGMNTGTIYLDIPALGNETTKSPAPEPLGQDRVISFRNSTPTTLGLSWLLPTSGAGTYRLAIAKATDPIDIEDLPVDGFTYTANAGYGLGDAIGNAFVVYNAAAIPTIANPLTVTGLTTGVRYYFRVFAYNSTEPGTENYNQNSAVFNPRDKVAGSAKEAVAGDENDSYESNALFNMSSIAPNPVKDVINFSITNYEALPMTIEVYNSEGVRVLTVQEGTTMSVGTQSFAIPTGNIAAGLYILKVSTGGTEFAIQSFIVMP